MRTQEIRLYGETFEIEVDPDWLDLMVLVVAASTGFERGKVEELPLTEVAKLYRAAILEIQEQLENPP